MRQQRLFSVLKCWLRDAASCLCWNVDSCLRLQMQQSLAKRTDKRSQTWASKQTQAVLARERERRAQNRHTLDRKSLYVVLVQGNW